MRTTKIVINSYKDTNLIENVHELFAREGMSDEEYDNISDKANEIFEYGEFLSAELIVDENLNIIGGKIIPHKSK